MDPKLIQAQIDEINARINLITKQRTLRVYQDAAQDAQMQKQLVSLQEALAKALS